MFGTIIPLSLAFIEHDPLIALLAEAYTDAASRETPMRVATEAFEAVRDAITSGDAARALWVIDHELGQAYGSALRGPLTGLRDRIWSALVNEIIGPSEQDADATWQRRLEVIATLWVNGFQASLLRRLLTACPRPSTSAAAPSRDALWNAFRWGMQDRWAEVYDTILALTAGVAIQPVRARLLMILGQIQLFHFVRFQKARAHLNQALELAPQDPKILGAIGQWHRQWGEIDKSKSEFFLRQIDQAPQSTDGYVNLGDTMVSEGDISGGEGQFQQGLLNGPGETDTSTRLMRLYGRPEFFESRADTILDLRGRVLSLDPDEHATIATNEADTHRRYGRIDLARAGYDLALSLEADRLDALIGKGLCAEEEADRLAQDNSRRHALYAEARDLFTRATIENPRAQEGYWQLSLLEEKCGNIDEALSFCTKVASCHPDWTVQALIRAGDIKRSAKRYDESEADLQKALQLDPGNRTALNSLALLADNFLYQAGDRQHAVRLYETIRDGWGDVLRHIYLNKMGNLFFYESDFANSITWYRRAVNAKPTDPVLHSNLAGALLKITSEEDQVGRMTEAVAALSRAASLEPTRSDYRSRLAQAEADLDLHRRYGAGAIGFRPAYARVSVRVHSGIVPLITDPSGTALKEAAREATEAARARLKQRFGLKVPPISYSDDPSAEILAGTYRVVIDGEDCGSGGPINQNTGDALSVLIAGVEDHLARCVARLVTLDTVAESLEGRNMPACEQIRRNLQTLVGFTRAVHSLALEGRLSDSAIDTIAESFLTTQTNIASVADPVRHETTAAGNSPARAPELSLRIGSELGNRVTIVDDELQTARSSVFDTTGVAVPVISTITDGALPVWKWILEIGGEAVSDATCELANGASSSQLGAALATALRKRASSLVSRQLVEHYLTVLAGQRPILVQTVRSLSGVDLLTEDLRARVASGGSIRNLPPLIAESIDRRVA
jgi:tetratricopeptide (TPR) repeat protein